MALGRDRLVTPRRSVRLYGVFKEYFGYSSSATGAQRKAFAWAISEAQRVLEQCADAKSWLPAILHVEGKHSALTAKMLDNARALVGPTLLAKASAVDERCKIQVPAAGLLTVLWTWVLVPGEQRICFFSFGKMSLMAQEVGLVRTLVRLAGAGMPFKPNTWTYWNLLNGTEINIADNQVPEVPGPLLLKACRRLFG